MSFRKWQQAEEKFGKPMPLILAELYDQHGKNKPVAEALGIKPKTLLDWCNYLEETEGCRRGIRFECPAVLVNS